MARGEGKVVLLLKHLVLCDKILLALPLNKYINPIHMTICVIHQE